MYRLILYSEQLASANPILEQRLLALIGQDTPRIGYIPSSNAPENHHYYRAQKAYYARLGADLTLKFGLDTAYDPSKLTALLACDAIHLTGGNTFYFLYWLQVRNMLEPLRKYVADGGVLIGVSAGAILMTPNISTSRLCGDELVAGLTDYRGLGLVDFAFVPHYGEPDVTLAQIQTYAAQHKLDVYACPDGSGIVVDGDQIERIGDITIMTHK